MNRRVCEHTRPWKAHPTLQSYLTVITSLCLLPACDRITLFHFFYSLVVFSSEIFLHSPLKTKDTHKNTNEQLRCSSENLQTKDNKIQRCLFPSITNPNHLIGLELLKFNPTARKIIVHTEGRFLGQTGLFFAQERGQWCQPAL